MGMLGKLDKKKKVIGEEDKRKNGLSLILRLKSSTESNSITFIVRFQNLETPSSLSLENRG